jgi:hypothetical protein
MTAILLAILAPGGLASIILEIIRDRLAATGKVLTLDELRAEVLKKADAIIADSEAWKAAHPPGG